MPGPERDRRHDLDDPSVEALLAGRVPDGREDLHALAASLGALRSLAQGRAPAPSAELAQLFAEPPLAAVGKWTAQRVETRTPRGRRVWARLPRVLAALTVSLLVKFSALGIGAKAALALTAVGAVAGGAAATDLPAAVADAFGGDRGAEQSATDAPEAADFGQGVADDASDPADPGVDGPSIADEARQRAEQRRPADVGPSDETEESEDHPAEDAAAGGLDKAREASDGTPSRVPEEVPAAGESPDTSDEKPASSPDDLPGPPEETPGLPDVPPGPPAQTPGLPDGPPGPPAEKPGGPPAD